MLPVIEQILASNEELKEDIIINQQLELENLEKHKNIKNILIRNDSIKKKNPEWDYFNYQAFILPWRISGTKEEIIKTNTKLIFTVSRDNNLPSLSSYIVDLCEYSKIKPDQDIFTYSITYQNMEGASTIPTPYNPPTDDFHIMPDGTIMPGKTHEEYLKTQTPSITTQTSSSTSPTSTWPYQSDTN